MASDFRVFQKVQTGSGAHPAFYSLGAGREADNSCPVSRLGVSGAIPPPPICLLGMNRDNFNFFLKNCDWGYFSGGEPLLRSCQSAGYDRSRSIIAFAAVHRCLFQAEPHWAHPACSCALLCVSVRFSSACGLVRILWPSTLS